MATADLITPETSAGPYTHEIVASLLDPPGSALVADMGPGKGHFTAYLERKGFRVIAMGIDQDDYQAGGYSSAEYLVANLEDEVPDPGERLGGIVAIEVVEHLESPLRFIRKAAERLDLGGWMILTTPNVDSIGSVLEVVFRGHESGFGEHEYQTNGHICPVSLRQIRHIAERVGLQVETVTYNIGKIPLPKIRQRWPLKHRLGRNAWLGDSLIVKLRKVNEAGTLRSRG